IPLRSYPLFHTLYYDYAGDPLLSLAALNNFLSIPLTVLNICKPEEKVVGEGVLPEWADPPLQVVE
ncbi:MAG: hypothetical protein AB1894_23860, partial [Chloroflexota bacterium]